MIVSRYLWLTISWQLFATVVSAAWFQFHTRGDVLLPSEDSFYQPPDYVECQEPGAILDKRQVSIPPALESLLPGVTDSVWQISYRSTDSSGNANAVVTTIFVPKNNKNPKKLLTHALAYDAADVDCSPSYTLRTSSSPSIDIAVIAAGLNAGWFVQSPDYETFTAGFTNGILSGRALLDSVRATLNSGSFTGISSDARIVLNGGSGGALACEFAAEFQASYAPELNIAAISLGSLTPDVRSVVQTINCQLPSALLPPALLGLSQSIPSFGHYLNEALNQSVASAFQDAGKQCLSGNSLQFAYKNVNQYFKDPNFLNSSLVNSVASNYGVMGKYGKPSVPVYVFKGALDEISPIQDTDALVEKYCAQGVSITYARNSATGHIAESMLGFTGAYQFLKDRMDDVPLQPGCHYINSTKTSFDASDKSILGDLGGVIIPVLQGSILGSVTL